MKERAVLILPSEGSRRSMTSPNEIMSNVVSCFDFVSIIERLS